MKINVNDGTITFTAGAINAQLSRKDFLNSKIGARAEEFLINEPYATYRIFPESGIVTTVQFAGDVLETVSVLFKMQDDGPETWSEAHELERKKIHDVWLRTEIGAPPYAFAWGRILSDYDAKACESDIFVAYGARRQPKSWWSKDQPT